MIIVITKKKARNHHNHGRGKKENKQAYITVSKHVTRQENDSRHIATWNILSV